MGFIKTGSSPVTLSGDNTFKGTVTVSAGTLNANSATALGAASSTAAISVASGAALSLGAALNYSSPGRTTTINSTGVSTGGALIHNYAGTANIGSITLGSASYVRGTATGTSTLSSSFTNAGFALTAGAASGNTLTLTGGISGLGGLVIGNSSSDTGTVALTTAKTYQGNTTLSYGTLSVGNAGALGSVGSLAFNGGTLDASVSGLTIANAFTLPYGVLYFAGTNSMELSANINIGSGTPSIRVSASTLTLSGLISGSGGSLDVSGSSSGTLRLLNGSNSYSGGTGIYSPVSFANGALGSAGSITLVNSSLKWDSGNTQDVSSRLVLSSIYATFDAGSNARIPFASAFGNNATTDVHTNGTATGGQTGVIDFRGANTFIGDVWIDTGSLWAAGSAALGPNRASTVRIASGGSLTIYNLSTALDYSSLTINLRGAGNSTDAGALVLSNAYSVNMGSIVLQENSAILGRMTAALTSGVDLSGWTLTLRSTSVNSTFIQGNITSSSGGSLVVGGGTYTGTVKLSGTNTHKNGTTISTGTLQAGSIQALSTVGTVSLSSGATLQTLTSGFSGQNGKLTMAALNNAAGGTIKIGG
jgi:autotransporter-associated beta strand protein